MKVKDYKKFACFNYVSQKSTIYELGDIVVRPCNELGSDVPEIGVILQIHDEYEYRTDMFGNCHVVEICLASLEQINKYRPDIIEDLI